jgi:hypothetical protein
MRLSFQVAPNTQAVSCRNYDGGGGGGERGQLTAVIVRLTPTHRHSVFLNDAISFMHSLFRRKRDFRLVSCILKGVQETLC